jgi:hypothetical protein
VLASSWRWLANTLMLLRKLKKSLCEMRTRFIENWQRADPHPPGGYPRRRKRDSDWGTDPLQRSVEVIGMVPTYLLLTFMGRPGLRWLQK